MSVILPSSLDEFRSKSYWEQFFESRRGKTFEWYGEYHDMESVFSKIGSCDKVLHVGNGNSTLPLNLRTMCKQQVCVDYSETVINEMGAKMWHNVAWMLLDVSSGSLTNTFGAESFDWVVDKGFTDAYFSCSHDLKSIAAQYFDQVWSVLRSEGTYFLISLAQKHIVDEIVRFFSLRSCRIFLHALRTQSNLQPFAIVIKKTAAVENDSKFSKFCFVDPESGADSGQSIFKLFAQVEEVRLQNYVTRHLKNFNPGQLEFFSLSTKDMQDPINVSLYDNEDADIVRLSKKLGKRTVALVVPVSEQTDWMYRTKDGHSRLAAAAQCSRLLVLCITEMDTLRQQVEQDSKCWVEERLSAALEDLSLTGEVVIMALEEHLQGTNNIVCREESAVNQGVVTVHDSEADEEGVVARMMKFSCNPRMVQAELCYVGEARSPNFLRHKICSEYQSMIYASLLPLARRCSPVKGLILGLGGGAIPAFLEGLFRYGLDLTCVELDPTVATIAKTCFGLDPKHRVVIADALHFIANDSEAYDFIVVDINGAGDVGMGSSPPPAFYGKQAIQDYSRLLNLSGLLIINHISYHQNNTGLLQDALAVAFKHIHSLKLHSDANRIVISTHIEEYVRDLQSTKELPKECIFPDGLQLSSIIETLT